MEEQKFENFFEEIKATGIEYDNHCSDLYIPRTSQTLEICKKWGKTGVLCTSFINQINHEIWLDIPFAYMPYWEKKIKG